MDSGFVKEKQNLLLYGPVGTGKTHLAIALSIEACQMGFESQFFTTGKLVEALLAHKESGNLARFMGKLEKLDLLVIDEFGYVPFNPEGAKLLFQVVADCYERKSIILTTNLEFQQWNSLLGDGHLAAQ
jgi:DNA replication protein DnaC